MSQIVTIAHDVLCPWCWIGFHQAVRLRLEFGVGLDFVGYELFPEGMAWPEPGTPEAASSRLPVPTRLQLAYAAQGMNPPTAERPKHMRTHNALEAMELAREKDVQLPVVEAVYRALWERGEAVGDADVLVRLTQNMLPETELRDALASRRFADRIVAFDDDAYAAGVHNVPTFVFGGRRFAEQPYSVLQQAVRDWLK